MWSKNTEIQQKAQRFFGECKKILWDIVFVYKNFLHWNMSKIFSLVCSFAVGFVLALPFVVCMLIIAFIDPIDWMNVLRQESFLWQLANIENVFWSLGVFLLGTLAFIMFFIWSGYYLIYMLRLSLSYVEGKRMKKKKLLHVSRKSFFCFFRMSCLNFLAIFTPVVIWLFIWSFGTYFFWIAFEQSLITRMLLVGVYVLIVYITYKVQFSFLIFADTKVTKNTSYKALKYIKKSIEIARPKYFIKFVIIVFLYFLILLPFRSIDSSLESEIQEMSNTYNFRNDLFTGLSQADREYLEFLSLDYAQYEDDQLLEKISENYRFRILYFLAAYILFGGLILLIVSSFYRHILLRK